MNVEIRCTADSDWHCGLVVCGETARYNVQRIASTGKVPDQEIAVGIRSCGMRWATEPSQCNRGIRDDSTVRRGYGSGDRTICRGLRRSLEGEQDQKADANDSAKNYRYSHGKPQMIRWKGSGNRDVMAAGGLLQSENQIRSGGFSKGITIGWRASPNM